VSARLGFRLAAAAFALLAILVAVLQARRPTPPPPPSIASAPTPRPIDARLSRCQQLGAAGAQDAECLKAWDQARSHFLGVPKASR
jgi:conjugative transfer region protein TrbK